MLLKNKKQQQKTKIAPPPPPPPTHTPHKHTIGYTSYMITDTVSLINSTTGKGIRP